MDCKNNLGVLYEKVNHFICIIYYFFIYFKKAASKFKILKVRF